MNSKGYKVYGAGSSLYGGTITINARKVKSVTQTEHVFDLVWGGVQGAGLFKWQSGVLLEEWISEDGSLGMGITWKVFFFFLILQFSCFSSVWGNECRARGEQRVGSEPSLWAGETSARLWGDHYTKWKTEGKTHLLRCKKWDFSLINSHAYVWTLIIYEGKTV